MNYNDRLMIENIKRELYSEVIKKAIQKFWKKTHSLYVISIIIGEIFTYYSINKNGIEFDDYLKDMCALYDETIDFEKYDYKSLKKKYKNISNIFDEVILDTEIFKIKRAKNIAKSIARKLKIEKELDEFNEQDKNLIKLEFIENYVKEGFVIHSFHSALKPSIISKGLSSNERVWNNEEIMKLGEIFFEKGAFGALGGYNYYNGQGLYFEHNYRKLYSHAIYSPEWFNFFTSSNHLTGFPDIERAPFALRNYAACKQNVLDLCQNTQLNNNQLSIVLEMFEKYYKMFESKKTTVAIIPKKLVDKDKINSDIVKGKDFIETIIYLLDDNNNEYKEHFGNVYSSNISCLQIDLIDLPNLDNYINITEFDRETPEELFELAAVDHMKRHLARILDSVGETNRAHQLMKNTGEN